jgi:hypothetical protein
LQELLPGFDRCAKAHAGGMGGLGLYEFINACLSVERQALCVCAGVDLQISGQECPAFGIPEFC